MADTGAAGIRIDVTEWEGLFALMRGRVSDMPKLLHTAYATTGFQNIIQHFADEASPDGKWKPLKYRKGKPLQDTGNLRKSILPSNWRSVNSKSIMVFANAPYGKIHDEGTSRIPQRKFMWLSQPTQQKMAEQIASIIVDG